MTSCDRISSQPAAERRVHHGDPKALGPFCLRDTLPLRHFARGAFFNWFAAT